MTFHVFSFDEKISSRVVDGVFGGVFLGRGVFLFRRREGEGGRKEGV